MTSVVVVVRRRARVLALFLPPGLSTLCSAPDGVRGTTRGDGCVSPLSLRSAIGLSQEEEIDTSTKHMEYIEKSTRNLGQGGEEEALENM